MIRFLVLLVIVVLVVIAFRMGRQSERGRLIDLEPDEARLERWASKDADPVGAKRTSAADGDNDVIDVSPEDVEVIGK